MMRPFNIADIENFTPNEFGDMDAARVAFADDRWIKQTMWQGQRAVAVVAFRNYWGACWQTFILLGGDFKPSHAPALKKFLDQEMDLRGAVRLQTDSLAHPVLDSWHEYLASRSRVGAIRCFTIRTITCGGLFGGLKMGIETIVMAAVTLVQASGQMSAAKRQAKATAAEGTLKAKNRAKETVLNAARHRSSFLNSGLTLEGTPMNVIENEFRLGDEDVSQITSNYNARARAQMAEGRNRAMSTLASGFGNALGSLDIGSVGMPESLGSFDGLPDPSSYGLTSANGAGFAGFGDGFSTEPVMQGTGGVY